MVVINPVRSMFWGVTIDAGKRYSQVVNQAFHLSMAALEPGTATANDYVQVMIQHGSSEFLMCSLQQGKLMQQRLDQIFATGEELSFSLVGKGTVHLTGYLLEDQPEDDEYSSDDESDAPQLVEMDADMLKAGSKRKQIDLPSLLKKKKMSESFDDDDDDEEDDDDYDIDEDDDSDDGDEDDFSEDDLTFDEDEDSDLEQEDSNEDEESDELQSPPKKKVAATPKGDNAGSAKKDKQGKTPKTPKTPTSENKVNEKKTPKTPQTPHTPANGETESAKKKKKKKKKKNKDGESSMNESTASSPEKSSSESTPKSAKKKEGNTPTAKIETPGKRKVVAGGTVVEDLKVGHGPEAKPGKMVSVYYVGKLSKTNKQFDSCSSGKPFRFRLKQGEVIKGWDNGVEGMKVGGKRKISIPPNQAYGNQKQGPIPANSALTFEVELKAVS